MRYLGQARPAAMLLVIPQLIWPEILVEVGHSCQSVIGRPSRQGR
jgi:hypothetical protein